MKRGNHVLEIVALLAIILIPVGFILYALFGTSNPASTPPAAQRPVQTTSNSPQYLSSAVISLGTSAALPTSVPADQFIPFSFTVTNTSASNGQVPFKVSVKWSTGEQDVIDENVVTLAAGASQTIQESLKFEIATETAQVSLQLPTANQTLRFTLPKAN